MANTVIQGPKLMWVPELQGRPGWVRELFDFFTWTFGLGIVYDPEAGDIRANRRTPIRDYEFFAISVVNIITSDSQNGEVLDYPAYVKRSDAEMLLDVEEYMLFSTVTEDEGTRPRRWDEYDNGQNPPTQVGSDWYVPLHGMGQYNPGSVISTLDQQVGPVTYTVVNEHQMSALLTNPVG